MRTRFCFAGTTEFAVLATATGTESLPASYTGCHAHGSETYSLLLNLARLVLTISGSVSRPAEERYSSRLKGQNPMMKVTMTFLTALALPPQVLPRPVLQEQAAVALARTVISMQVSSIACCSWLLPAC
jgi:hypothetical protein